MTPASKEEIYLAKLCGEDWKLPYPASRLEYYYAKLCGMDVPLPAEPLSRPELYLAYLCGMDVKLPKPVSRKEMYMAKACGMDVRGISEPLSKSETYWYMLSNNIQNLVDKLPLIFTSTDTKLVNYQIYGNSFQNGIPTCMTPIEIVNVGEQVTLSSSNLPTNPYQITVECTQDKKQPIVTNIYLPGPLCKIDQYSDYIDYGRQLLVRNIQKLIFTGDENWAMQEINTLTTRFRVDIQHSISQSSGLCSHVPFVRSGVSRDEALCGINNNTFYFRINKEIASNVIEFKDYLSSQAAKGTPVTIYYVRSTLYSQSLSLPNIQIHKGTTTLNVNADLTPSSVSIYYKT